MGHRLLIRRPPLLEAYVVAVIGLGALCCAAVLALDGGSLHRVLTPEVLLFAGCALVGELFP